MSDIGTFTPEQARELWQDLQRRKQLNPTLRENYPVRREVVGRPTQRLQVIMKEDLNACANTLNDETTAQAYVLVRGSDGNLSQSTDEIAVVNRFRYINIPVGTYAKAEWIDGEWQLYAADCEA